MKDETISAFAFNVGKQIEQICEEKNGGLQKQLESLQSSILTFRRELTQSNNENMLRHFDIVFGIEIAR